MVPLIPILIIFFIVFSILLIYIKQWYHSNLKRKTAIYVSHKDFNPKISIIICARNEALNLEKNLEKILNQSYTNIEVIVIDHDSTDNSQEILNVLKSKYAKLVVCKISLTQNQYKGKKQALYEGFQIATGAFVIITDADCWPVDTDWVKEMIQPFEQQPIDFVLAYAPYTKEKGFLNDIVQYETITTFQTMQYFNDLGKPYMAVGRNMAIRKSILTEAYWEKYNSIPYGDDDLLLQYYGNAKNVYIKERSGSAMFSNPETIWKYWWHQKMRHLQAGKYYKKNILVLLTILHITELLQLIVLIFTISCIYKNIVLIYLSIPLIGLYILQYRQFKKREGNEIGFGKFVLIKNLMVIYYLFSPLISFFYKNNIWQRNTPYQ